MGLGPNTEEERCLREGPHKEFSEKNLVEKWLKEIDVSGVRITNRGENLNIKKKWPIICHVSKSKKDEG